MYLSFIPAELRQFSEAYRVPMWSLGEDYCLLDWLGFTLPNEPSYFSSFSGMITRKKYLTEISSLEELSPENTLDSFLFKPLQLAKFLRWAPADPMQDDLLSGQIGWVPAEAGPIELRLPAAAQNLLSKMRAEVNFETAKGVSHSMDVEIMAAALNSLFDPASSAKAILDSFSSNLSEIALYPRNIIAQYDIEFRLEHANEIQKNFQRGLLFGPPKAPSIMDIEYYAGGPTMLFFPAQERPGKAEQALNELVKKIAIFWQKIIPA